MRRLLEFVALTAIVFPVAAQRQRPQPTAIELRNSETALQKDPRDRATMNKLLEDYFYGHVDPAIAVPARRRHILWLIENTPDDELAGGPRATIDPSGHGLADPEGFRLASAAWRAQVSKPDVKPAALLNAAYFFKTDDKAYTISLLKRALALEPASKETAARLGDEYALVIMGVTEMTWTGYPVKADPSLTESALAKEAREALSTSRNPYLLAKAGYMLLWQGGILYYSRALPFNPEPLAKSTLDRAVSLAPGDREVASLRAEYDKWQLEKQHLLRAAGAEGGANPPSPASPIRSQAVASRPSPGLEASSATVATAAAPRPPAPEPKATDLAKVSAGMSREQLLELGSPAGRITMDEDGHLIEIFQYSTNGVRLGSIRLRDGVVSSVQVP